MDWKLSYTGARSVLQRSLKADVGEMVLILGQEQNNENKWMYLKAK